MTHAQIIEQLRSLIEDAETHREPDGTLDDVYQDDITALAFAIVEVKRAEVWTFCHQFGKCGDCPMREYVKEKNIPCVLADVLSESELDTLLAFIRGL